MNPIKSVTFPRGPVLREIGLAALAGVVFAVSPFTPNEFTPSALGGLALAAGLLGFRLRRNSPVWQETVGPRLGRDQLLAVGIGVLCLAAFAPTLAWMYNAWTVSLWFNDHGIFMPFVMAWLVHQKLAHDDAKPASSIWGFLPLGLGLGLSILDANAQSRYLAAFGLLIALPGVSLLLLGGRRTWAIRTPLLLGVLLIPIPYSVAAPLGLRLMTAKGVVYLLQAFGVTVVREGTQLQLPPAQNFVVADACSGANALWASLAIAIVLMLTTTSLWRRVVIPLLAPLLAIGANVVRVTILVLLTGRYGTGLLDTPIHEATGVATFFGVLVPLMAIAYARPAASAR